MTDGPFGPGPWGARGPGDLEIVQTRDITRREASEVSRAASMATASMTLHDPLYWICLAALAACATAVGIGFSRFIYWAECMGVRFPTWAGITFFIGLGSYFLAFFRRTYTVGMLNRRRFKAGARYVLLGEGLSVEMRGAVTFLPWRAMQSLFDSGPCLFVRLEGAQVMPLTKAAFEEQDGEGFCAELRRRRERHLTNGSEASTNGNPE